mmetsp:Transcript_39079/g.80024  ORF Transcript_39079/g.80024 Transcript_39079/m.80024 type:complete len:169 (-) Transcript_39079:1171-1677(-)
MSRSRFVDVTDEDDDAAAGGGYGGGGGGIMSQNSWATQATHDTSLTAAGRSVSIRQEISQQRQELLSRLHETGEMKTIKSTLRAQLVECGWREEMRNEIQNAIRQRGGIGKVTVDELVEELKPRSKSAVPENVKSNLMNSVTDFVRRERGEIGPDGVEIVLKPGMSEV